MLQIFHKLIHVFGSFKAWGAADRQNEEQRNIFHDAQKKIGAKNSYFVNPQIQRTPN